MTDPQPPPVRRLDPRVLRWILTVCASMLLLTGINAWFTIYRANQAAQATCPVITVLDRIYQARPSTTATGRAVANAIHGMAAGCPKGKP